MARTYRVRVLIEISREYGRRLLRGICRYSSLHGQWQIEQQTPFYLGDGTIARSVLSTFASGGPEVKRRGGGPDHVDGIIMRDYKGSLGLLKKGIPTIFATYLHEDIPNSHKIVTDDPVIARLAAAHLRERGFRQFAFVGYDGLFWSRRRREGFVRAVQAAGCECATFMQTRRRKERRWSREQGPLTEWLKALPKPAGLMACNDDRARQVVDACLAAGLRVPEEIALIGVDDDEFVCKLANPPISSVALDVEDAGYRAAQLLHRLMTGGKPRPQTIVVPTLGVVTRGSSEVTAIQDAVVANAVRFIRANCRKPIQVTDVLREVAISRRGLYDRFHRVLGCGVHQYIKKVRVAEIERLLQDTDCSVAAIAGILGFPTPSHVASYFRSVRGTNPQSLRRHGMRR